MDWLLQIGGITVETGKQLGRDLTLAQLQADYDAVFLGIGLGGVNALGLDGEDKDGVLDAVDFIADLRQASDLSTLPVGRDVVVIGGGMTAVDAAVQSKLLGALNVTPCLSPRARPDERQPRLNRIWRPPKACGSSPMRCPSRCMAMARCARSNLNIPMTIVTAHGPDLPPCRRSGVQGHRPDAGRRLTYPIWRAQDRRNRSWPHQCGRRLGRGRLCQRRR